MTAENRSDRYLGMLADGVRGLDRVFSCGGTTTAPAPVQLRFDGQRRVQISTDTYEVEARVARRLKKECAPAPFGVGSETWRDTNVRDGDQLLAHDGALSVVGLDLEGSSSGPRRIRFVLITLAVRWETYRGASRAGRDRPRRRPPCAIPLGVSQSANIHDQPRRAPRSIHSAFPSALLPLASVQSHLTWYPRAPPKARCFGRSSAFRSSWRRRAAVETTGVSSQMGATLAWTAGFQMRKPSLVSLRALDGNALDYQAFIYPRFVQQELGDRMRFIDMWKTSGRARSAAQLDDLLNDLLPFADHFRDFAVRNFNTTLTPGDPVAPHHHAIDDAIPEGLQPVVLEPKVTLDFPGEISRPVKLQPLTAQYEPFVVDPHIASVRIDLQGVQNSAFVRADVLVKVGGAWERRRVPGLVFEFCREDPGDDITDLYLIVSHHDRGEGHVADGDYQIRTRFDCPSGWEGTIRYVHTLEDHTERTDAVGSASTHRSEREVQTWTVTGSRDTDSIGAPYTELSLNWTANFERQIITQFMPTVCIGDVSYTFESTSGVGSGADTLGLFALGGDAYAASPTAPADARIDAAGIHSVTYCTGEHAEFTTSDTRFDQISTFASVPGLSMLSPTTADGIHYRGSASVLHSEMPQEGGSIVIDETMTWDLERR